MTETHDRADRWLDTVDKAFHFATMARERFITGDLKTKREILTAIGQKFSLKDGILAIEHVEWLEAISNQQKTALRQVERLEPADFRLIDSYTRAFAQENPHRGGQRELNP